MSLKRNNFKTFISDNMSLILSFIIPLIIMIGIFIGNQIYPFGNRTFLQTDLYHQYAPFFSEFLEKLKTGGSLAYSWDIGLGSNFVDLYAYYLASPLNWLVFLFPKGLLLEFMAYLIVIKMALSGFTFAYYLSKRNNTKKTSICFFAVFYALSAYMAAYSWNIMWLDCMWLAPLIMLGLEKLVKEGKWKLYCFSLGIAIISNYYISIMICIFMVLYFIVLMVSLPSHTIKKVRGPDGELVDTKIKTRYMKKILSFALFSLLAGGLSAILLIPTSAALSMTASGSFDFPSTITSYFSVIEMAARHFMNVTVEKGLDHWPNIYCGVAVLMLFPLYIMNKRVTLREKISRCVLIIVLLLSFSLNVPNFIWHGLHYPNSLPARQSFLYIALLLSMCYDAIDDARKYSVRQIVSSFWIAAAFILICEKIIDVDDFDYHVYYLTLLFVGLYALFMYLYKRGMIRKNTAVLLAIGVVVIESTINMAVTSVRTTDRVTYLSYTEEYQEVLSAVESDSSDFYRIEKDNRRTKNDAAWVGYSSASIFSSTTNANVTEFYKKMGMEGNTNAYSFTGATPFASSLLSVRYIISEDAAIDDPLMSVATTAGTKATASESTLEDGASVMTTPAITLYENTYSLPLGFMVDSSAADGWYSLSGNPLQLQNSFATLLTGVDDLFEPLAGTTSGNSFTLYTQQAQHVYVYISNSSIKKVVGEVTKPGEALTSQTYDNVNRGYLLDLGYCPAGTQINVYCDEEESVQTMSAVAYSLNMDNYIEAMNLLNESPLIIDSFSDTKVTGHITVSEDGLLYTSIPYEDGWTLKVDGVETTITQFADTFIAVPLSAGVHSVELTYSPSGLSSGALISLASLLILIILIAAERVLKKRSLDNPVVEEHLPLAAEPVKDTVPTAGQETSSAIKIKDSRPHLEVKTEDDELFVDAKTEGDGSPLDVTASKGESSVDVKANEGEPSVDVKANEGESSVDVKANEGEPSVDVKVGKSEPSVDVKANEGEPSVDVKAGIDEPTMDANAGDNSQGTGESSANIYQDSSVLSDTGDAMTDSRKVPDYDLAEGKVGEPKQNETIIENTKEDDQILHQTSLEEIFSSEIPSAAQTVEKATDSSNATKKKLVSHRRKPRKSFFNRSKDK